MMNKIPAVTITITRAEGPTALCGITKTFENPQVWTQADAWLRSQAGTFPTDGSVDKHDFCVTFLDGETYESSLGCKASGMADNDLSVGQHIRQHLTHMAGRAYPAHLPRAQWEDYLKMANRCEPGISDQCGQFLDTYALEDRI